MSLTESIVEDSALTWSGELGYAVAHAPHLAPGEMATERSSFSDVVLIADCAERLHDSMLQFQAMRAKKRFAKCCDTMRPH